MTKRELKDQLTQTKSLIAEAINNAHETLFVTKGDHSKDMAKIDKQICDHSETLKSFESLFSEI